MSFSEIAIDLQCPGSCSPGFCESFCCRHKSIIAKQCEAIRESGIGKRVSGILIDCLLKIINGLF